MAEVMHKGAGHRKRLRQKFLQSGFDAFLDYEIVELLLTLGTPRRDCKQMAKDAIKKFKGLKGVLDASTCDLQSINGIGPSNVFGIKIFHALSERYSKEKISSKVSLNSPKAVSEYLRHKIGLKKKEYFVVLHLNSQKHLLGIEDVSFGTINETTIHPREVFESAIRHLASSIVIAHNHPSGELEPSVNDLRVTQRLASVGDLMGICLDDHIIVSSQGYVSFKEKGLI